MKPSMHLVEISIFSLNSVTVRHYEQPPRTSQNSDFQSHFSVLKIGRILPNVFSVKNIGLGVQLLLNIFFKILYFLKMYPIFVGTVHNFGKSDDDKI